MKKFLVIISIFSLLLAGGEAPQEVSQRVHNYYKEICLATEFEGARDYTFWYEPVRVYVVDDMPGYMWDELNRIISELNKLGVNISVVNNINSSNFLIYYRSGVDYERVEPGARGYTGSNWGFVNFRSIDHRIIDATMYVDKYRTDSIQAKKHLLREELTQGLGFINDSWWYPDSIFYQGWTTTTEYAPIDRELINAIYGN